MGMVYEAMDLKVDHVVALKCARPGHHLRLSKEVRAAAEVSHFNVCRIHDFHTVSTPEGECDCISMELIEGETLQARIRREGPLPHNDAIAIADQICAGLAQAHAQGVVHGDLKCGNVMLETQQPRGNLRAVITDFGLAHLEGDDPTAGGTLDYMAPEQLEGRPASRRSDIYSLGIMFHVMLTGHVPRYDRMPEAQARRGETRLTTMTLGRTSAQVGDARRNRKIERLKGRWDRTVRRCLAPNPADRFAQAAAVAQSLHPRHWIRLGIAAVVFAAALIAGASEWQARANQSPVRLDILPFEGSAASEGKGLGAEIAQRLNGARRRFTVVTGPLDAGASHVLRVRLDTAGDARFHAAITLADQRSGTVIRELSADYSDSEKQTLAKAIVALASEAFRLPAGIRETVAPSAYANYVAGLEALREQDLNGAVSNFEKAARADPASALPVSGLAEAFLERSLLTGTGDLESAEAAIAEARRINPDAVEVLLASGFAFERRGKYELAIRQFSRATELSPENGQAWQRLAHAYSLTGQTAEAIATFKKAIDLEPRDYRRYQALALEYFQRGQYPEAVIPFRKAAELAPGIAQVHEDLGATLIQLGQTSEAEAQLTSALKLRPSRNLLINLGALFYSTRRFTEAAAQFERSLQFGTPVTLQYRDLGDAYRQLGRKREAAAAYREGRRLAEEDVARNPRSGPFHARLGLLRAFLGERDGAQLELSQAIALEPGARSVMRDSAIAWEALGERDKALAVLAGAPASFLRELSGHPDLKSLTADRRFSVIIPASR
jgi:tetratricopeptide (TPR) repeat protein